MHSVSSMGLRQYLAESSARSIGKMVSPLRHLGKQSVLDPVAPTLQAGRSVLIWSHALSKLQVISQLSRERFTLVMGAVLTPVQCTCEVPGNDTRANTCRRSEAVGRHDRSGCGNRPVTGNSRTLVANSLSSAQTAPNCCPHNLPVVL
jgi:hypothetical protein